MEGIIGLLIVYFAYSQTDFRICSFDELGGGYLQSLSGVLEDAEGVPPPIGSL